MNDSAPMRLRVPDIPVSTIIGVYDWEQSIEQTLYVTVETEYQAQTHNDQWIDYEMIVRRVIDHANAGSHRLIEVFARELLDTLWQPSLMQRLRITVRKNVTVAGKWISPNVTVERA